MNYPEAATIAQALKREIRTGGFWEAMPGATKESLDQISTSIARMVAGDGVHWDAIIGYAHAAKPGTGDAFEPYTTPKKAEPPSTIDIERGIRQMVRDRNGNG